MEGHQDAEGKYALLAARKLRPPLGHVAPRREGHHDGDGVLDLGEASLLFLAFLEPHVRLAVGDCCKDLLELLLEPLEDLVCVCLFLPFAVLDHALHLGLGFFNFPKCGSLVGQILPVDVDLGEENLLSGSVVVFGLPLGHVAEAHAEGVRLLLDFLESEVHAADFLQLLVVVGDLLGQQRDVTDRFIVLELLGRNLLLQLEYLPLELLHPALPLFQLALEPLLVLPLPDVLDIEAFVEFQFMLDLGDSFVELLFLPCEAR